MTPVHDLLATAGRRKTLYMDSLLGEPQSIGMTMIAVAGIGNAGVIISGALGIGMLCLNFW